MAEGFSHSPLKPWKSEQNSEGPQNFVLHDNCNWLR